MNFIVSLATSLRSLLNVRSVDGVPSDVTPATPAHKTLVNKVRSFGFREGAGGVTSFGFANLMKLRFTTFVTPLIAAVAALSPVHAAAPSPKNLAVPANIPPHYSQIPAVESVYEPPYPGDHRVDLAGGATAYLVPDSTLDLVRFYLYATGPQLPGKPEDVVRLRLYSALLKDGGTKALSPAQLEDSLEFIAAGLGASRGAWQGEASFDALGKDADAMLSLMAEVLLQPRLDADIFKVMQRRMVEGHKHRFSTPPAVLGAAAERVMQGSHPANWVAIESELKKVTPASLNSLAGSGYVRENLVIGVAGRFDRADMVKTLETFVARFPSAAKSAAATPPAFKGPRAPGVYVVDKPFTQASIRLAAPGVQRPHPDYYRLLVASEIFGGGGFTSRLSQRVRSDEGLAYSVTSDVESDYNRRGTVRAGLQTKAETGAYAVRIVLDEMRHMADSGITDVELARAKDGLLKSLPALFASPAATARIFAQSEAWGRSPDHFRNYRRTIETMTRAEVEAAFRRYFVADSMRIIVTGPKAELLKPDARGVSLADFGAITEITEAELDRRE
jgi:zinc protease